MSVGTTAWQRWPTPARWLLGAAFVEWVGNGLFVAISAVYFVQVVGLSANEVGAGFAIAGAVALTIAVPIGRLADRHGPRVVLVVIDIAAAAGVIGYLFVHSWAAFVLVGTVVIVCEQTAPALVQALVATAAGDEYMTRVMAGYRTMVNLAISIGGLMASLGLVLFGNHGFTVLFVANSATFVIGSVVVWTRVTPPQRSIPAEKPAQPGLSSSTLSVLRDRRLALVTGLNGLSCMWLPILNIGFPLWLASATDAPVSLVGLLYAVNTVACVLLQIPFSRFGADPPSALRLFTVAGLSLGMSCLGFVAAAAVSGWAGVIVAAAAIIALTIGELSAFTAATTLSYAIAPPDRRGTYLAAFGIGRTLSTRVMGPIVITGGVLALGDLGWATLAAVFLLMALLIRTRTVRATMLGDRD